MINKIIAFSIRNKLFVGLFTLFIAGWGIYSLTKVSIDAVPDITNNQVQVITTSQNLAAQEVEQFITYPVELAMANLPGVTEIRSISRFGLSVVTVVFEEDMGTYLPRQLVGEKLKEAQENIGDGLGTPEMGPISTGLGEIYQYTLGTDPGYEAEYDAIELRTIQDWIVKRQLSMIQGVVEISSWGGYLKQYEVAIDPNKLNGFDLTLPEVFEALQTNNENTGGSYIEKGPNLYYIRGKGLVKDFTDISNIVITKREGIPVTIKDVGKVGIGTAPRYGAATVDGQGETVIGMVMMLKGANSAEVVDKVKQRIAQIQPILPEGVRIKPFLDRTRLVEKTTSTISENLILGGLIVIFALVFLLGTLRSGLIVASVIPLSFLFALGMMNTFGVSANLMSLGAIDFGIIVDGAVIIVEFMVVLMLKKFGDIQKLAPSKQKEQINQVAIKASSQMMNAAIFGQVIILIVFIPILTLTGIEGKMFRPMALTFGFAILGAMILCLTYVPMVTAAFLYSKKLDRQTWGDKFMRWLETCYTPIIIWALKAKGWVISTALGFVAIAALVFLNLGGEFIPQLDEGDFALETRMAPGTSLKEMTKNMNKLETILLEQFPEVKTVITKIGAGEIPTDPMPIEGADVMVTLKDKTEWTTTDSKEELANQMRKALSVLPGIDIEFSQPIEMRFNELMTGVKQDIAVKIYGEDLEVLQDKGNEVASIIRQVEGSGDVLVEQVVGLPQIVIDYNRKRIAEYGLSISSLNQIVSTAFSGGITGKVFEGEKRFDLVLRLATNSRRDIAAVKKLYVPLANGNRIPLSEVADISIEDAPAQISRDNTYRRIVIGVNVRNRDTQSFVEEIQSKLSGIKLPPGYSITYGGEFENLERAQRRLSIVVPLVLGLIFAILFINLRSFKQTMLIYTAIPFAAVGGIFALWFRGMPFSISAGVGFIALFGVAVLNGLVLISSLNDLKSEGVTDVTERIKEATRSRLRPIFLTAITDILGFLPMALSDSAGAEVQRPLATVVIGGIITASLLTLIVLPVIYLWMENGRSSGQVNKTVIATGIVFFIFIPYVKAQDPQLPLTADQAVQLALENNGLIKAGQYRIESHKALEKTAFNPGKTTVETQYGKYNSFENDLAFGVSQNFSFPTVYSKRSHLLKAETKGAELQLKMTANELAAQVKTLWYDLLSLQQQRLLLQFQDSIYTKFQEAAQLRVQVGEINQLEMVSAQAQLMEVRNLLNQNDADQSSIRYELSAILQISHDFKVNGMQGGKRSISSALLLKDSLLNSPVLNYIHQQVEIAENQQMLSKAKMYPDITVGYQNQSLQGFYDRNGSTEFVGRGTRFQSVSVGVTIPLWLREYTKQTEVSKLEQQVAQATYTQEWRNYQGRVSSLIEANLKHKNTLAFYEGNLLKQADIILNNIQLSFSQGEIGYVEFVQGVKQSLKIKSDYIKQVRLYNQSVIELERIKGQQ
ncbi:CusA/CzcA family heavy metal efflux RND transporter [Algivirga pacifica]|uniref:CusA/CzcA family heavy metal efflux RND transporter n=1 Tax=Algivirga pacifica TaxID=1162670 RepID=A0ABP9DJG2_9BACT